MNYDIVTEAMASDPVTAAIGSDPVSSFVIQLLATGVGAALGFGGALIISSLSKKDDKEDRKKNTIKAIHEELKNIDNSITSLGQPAHVAWDAAQRQFHGSWISTSTPAFQSSVNAGDFTLLDTKLQTEIGNVYLSIKEYDLFSQQRMEFPFSILMQSTECNIEANKLVTNVNFAMDKLTHTLAPLLSKLEK